MEAFGETGIAGASRQWWTLLRRNLASLSETLPAEILTDGQRKWYPSSFERHYVHPSEANSRSAMGRVEDALFPARQKDANEETASPRTAL